MTVQAGRGRQRDGGYLVGVYEHHERVALARRVLFALQEVRHQLGSVGNEEVEIPAKHNVSSKTYNASNHTQSDLQTTDILNCSGYLYLRGQLLGTSFHIIFWIYSDKISLLRIN